MGSGRSVGADVGAGVGSDLRGEAGTGRAVCTGCGVGDAFGFVYTLIVTGTGTYVRTPLHDV